MEQLISYTQFQISRNRKDIIKEFLLLYSVYLQ